MAVNGGKRKGAGRPKGSVNKVTAEIRSLAQKHGEKAFQRVLELMECDDPRIAFNAAQEVLNRAYGKPTQSVEHGGPDGGAVPVSVRVTFVDAKG